MKITLICGARPNFVKIAPITRAIDKHNASGKATSIQAILIHTGQHYDYEMSQVFFEDLQLAEPYVHLSVGSGTHAEQTGKALVDIERVLMREKPDVVVVVGDVNSTMAAALAAVKLHISVAHVEAGVRMYDMHIPEEVNRVLTDHVSSLLFAPTQTAADNLKKEGITKGVHLTGDTMLDSFLHFSIVAERDSKILSKLSLRRKGYLLATVHRASNTDDEQHLKNIVDAFLNVEELVVFPLHPRTEKCLKQYGLHDRLKTAPNLRVIEPVGYLDSITLTRNARRVLTDSGGLQKEAYFARVPCITLDETTAWVETVDDGWNTLVGSNKERVIQAVRDFEPSGKQRDVFGGGEAAERIVEILIRNHEGWRQHGQSLGKQASYVGRWSGNC